MDPAHDRKEDGFTLLEVIIVMTILMVVIFVVVQLFLRSNQAHELAIRLNRATELNQAMLQDMRADLSSSVRLFENNALGNAYQGILDMTDANPPMASVLPTIDAAGIFRQEAATGALTGNTLLFANYAWIDEFQCTSGNQYLVEVHRVVRYYMARENGGPTPTYPVGLNLCRWVSEPMVDGDQIDTIFDPADQAEVLEHLLTGTPDVDGQTHPVVEVVWRVGEDLAAPDTLRQIEVGGTLSDTPVAPRDPAWAILRDPALSSNSLLLYRHFSVASNYAPQTAGVGRFSVPTNAGDGFPHGFEVQITGPSAGRQVLLQLSLMSTWLGGLPTTSSQRIVVNMREM